MSGAGGVGSAYGCGLDLGWPGGRADRHTPSWWSSLPKMGESGCPRRVRTQLASPAAHSEAALPAHPAASPLRPEACTRINLRLYVYHDGALVAKSDGIIAIVQSVLIPSAPDGVYNVYVAYDPDSPVGSRRASHGAPPGPPAPIEASRRRTAVFSATVLFTDIVGATEKAAALGDRRWRELLGMHHAVVREQFGRFRGREVDTAGDGFLAAFDGPGRAVDCAQAVTREVRRLGLDIRAGVHTGECEVMGDKLSGIAVHIGARVAALARAGEVLVSGTVKDLVAGSGITFEDRGLHVLRGVPGEWRVYAAASP
jgi:class 3 adenylate cyclase